MKTNERIVEVEVKRFYVDLKNPLNISTDERKKNEIPVCLEYWLYLPEPKDGEILYKLRGNENWGSLINIKDPKYYCIKQNETKTQWVCEMEGNSYVRTLIEWNDVNRKDTITWHLNKDQVEGETYLSEVRLEELFRLTSNTLNKKPKEETLTIRIDNSKKNDFQKICESENKDMSRRLNEFIEKEIKEKRKASMFFSNGMKFEKFIYKGVNDDGTFKNEEGQIDVNGGILKGYSDENNNPFITISLPRSEDGVVEGIKVTFKNIATYDSIILSKNKSDLNYIADLEKRCKLAHFAPFDDRIESGGNFNFIWDSYTINLAESWIKKHHPEL